jgi:hypothetical protein
MKFSFKRYKLPENICFLLLSITTSVINAQNVLLTPSASQTVTQPTVGNQQTTLAVNSLNGTLNASLFPGDDIGAKVNSAIEACSVSGVPHCTIFIPAGTYTQTNTIVMPAITIGQQVLRLQFDSGATLNYNGTGDSIDVGTNSSYGVANGYVIANAHIVGTASSTGAAIHAFIYGYEIDNPVISGFSNGAGILFDGSGQALVINPQITTSMYGLKWLGNANLGGHTPDANTVISGNITQNTYGWYNVPGANGSGLTDYNNEAIGVTISANTNNIVDIGTFGSSFHNSYIEGNASGTSPMVLGSSTIGTYNCKIEGNHFYAAAGSPSVISHVQGTGCQFIGNANVVSSVQYFVSQGAFADNDTFINNSGASFTSGFTNSGGYKGQDLFLGVTGTIPQEINTTTNGVGINMLSGNGQDLTVVCRSEGSRLMNLGPGGGSGYFDCSGNLLMGGGVWANVLLQSPTVNATSGYQINGAPGFTGTKTAGSCVFSIVGGIITGVSGC